MESSAPVFSRVPDLTTDGLGVHADAEALVVRRPRIEKHIPGWHWSGQVETASAVIRLPDAEMWNGKLLIGATPAVRTEYSLDLLLGDIAVQRGYAFAACDKGTPMLTLRDPSRQMTEWTSSYKALTELALECVQTTYGQRPNKTYISGVSNGGYVTRAMLEQHHDLFDGGVEWEGVLWQSRHRHLMTCLPVYVEDYPVYCNWRGDRTGSERSRALERLLEAGLHPASEPHWSQYFMVYWIVSLWLYGRNLDPEWPAFQQEWSNDWLRDPSPLAYPWEDRLGVLEARINPISNTGKLHKPLLSVAGNWDCLVSYRHNAAAYADLVKQAGFSHHHRMYEIDRGNHVEGFLRTDPGQQQAVHPYYEAALVFLEEWVEHGTTPPDSGMYETVDAFAPNLSLYTKG